MDIQLLQVLLRYDPVRGSLYRGVRRIKGTERYEGGPLCFSLQGKVYSLPRVCWALYHGSEPVGQVRHHDMDRRNNRPENLFDTRAPVRPHKGKYPGVSVLRDQRTGKHRGYQGSVYVSGVRHRTEVAETPEAARDLRETLQAKLAAFGEFKIEKQENGKYRGSVRKKGVTYLTPEAENPITARDLCVMLKVQVELQH